MNKLNIKEAMKALVDGKKLTKSDWGREEFVELDNQGDLVFEDGDQHSLNTENDDFYTVYRPPEKTIKVWQWRIKIKENPKLLYQWKVASNLRTEEQAAKYYHDKKYEKHAGPFEVEQ